MKFKNFHQRFRNSYAKLIAIIVLSLIPMFLISMTFIMAYYKNSQERVVTANDLIAQASFGKVFDSLENLQIGGFSLLSSDDVGFLNLLEATEQSYSERLYYANRVRDKMIDLEVSSDYVKEITLITEQNDILSTHGVILVSRSGMDSLYQTAFEAKGNFFCYEGQLYIVIKIVSGLENPAVVILGELDTQAIFEQISEPAAQHSNGCYLVISDTNTSWRIVTGNSDESFQAYLAKPEKSTRNVVQIGGKNFTVSRYEDRLQGLSMVAYMSESSVNAWLFMALSVLTIAITASIIRIDWKLIKKIVATPVDTLVSAFQNAEQGQYAQIKAQFDYDKDFAYIAEQVNVLIEKLQQSTAREYEQELRTQQAELKHMQAQINPHFLYNSLFTVSRLAKDGNGKLASEFANYLAKYFSYLTRSGSGLATLSDEVNHLNTYLQIMRYRFSNRIHIHVQNEVQESNIMIPKLIIQPLAENAFEHGLKDVLADGELNIRIWTEKEKLLVTVEDNGGLVTQDVLQNIRNYVYAGSNDGAHTGLYNVNKRLKLCFGSNSGLLFQRNDEDGLRVTAVIERKSEVVS